jgi:hypothetical protein
VQRRVAERIDDVRLALALEQQPHLRTPPSTPRVPLAPFASRAEQLWRSRRALSLLPSPTATLPQPHSLHCRVIRRNPSQFLSRLFAPSFGSRAIGVCW